MMTKGMPSPPIPNLPVISLTLGHPSLKEFLHVKSGGMTYDLTLNFFCGNYFQNTTVSDSLLPIVICT
jgi:hypothetical protein